jgi:hypothetical protein
MPRDLPVPVPVLLTPLPLPLPVSKTTGRSGSFAWSLCRDHLVGTLRAMEHLYQKMWRSSAVHQSAVIAGLIGAALGLIMA